MTAPSPAPRHVIWNSVGKNRTISDIHPLLFIVQHGCCGDPRGFNLLIHLQRYHLGLYTQTKKKPRWTWPYAYWSLHRALRVWSACWGIRSRGRYYAHVIMKWTGYIGTSFICEQTESCMNRENFTRHRLHESTEERLGVKMGEREKKAGGGRRSIPMTEKWEKGRETRIG